MPCCLTNRDPAIIIGSLQCHKNEVIRFELFLTLLASIGMVSKISCISKLSCLRSWFRLSITIAFNGITGHNQEDQIDPSAT